MKIMAVLVTSYLLALGVRFSKRKVSIWICRLTQKGWFIPVVFVLLLTEYFYFSAVPLLMVAALAQISDTNIEVARDVGASKWYIFRAIVFPLTYKAWLLSALLLFIRKEILF